MFDKDKWQEIFGTIRKNKLRTILTALGVFWGVFMLIFLLGMGSGLESGVFKNFGSQMRNKMYVWGERTNTAYKGFPAGRRIRISLEDLDAIKREIPEVDMLGPRRRMNNTFVNYKDKSNNYDIRGEYPSMVHIEPLVVREGRYINEQDLLHRRKVAVLGENTSKLLFEDQSPIGEYIMIKGIAFKVVGVFGPIELKPWRMGDTESIVVPLNSMCHAFGLEEIIDYMAISSNMNSRVSVAEQKVVALLKNRHQIHPDDPNGIGHENVEEEIDQVVNLFIGIKSFLWFVGIGTLLAGIVGVSNIMLIIVKERTKEIGIRKALGATPGSIVSMILTESVFITAMAGYLGLLLGTVVIGGISYAMLTFEIETDNFYNPQVNLAAGIGALIMLVIAGTIAGLIPAMQAANINPVEALKDE